MLSKITALLVAAAALGCTAPPPDDGYLETLTADRALKNDVFAASPESPVRPEHRDVFLPLSYYEIDERFRVPATLDPAPESATFTMPTSTGSLRAMRRAGTLRFSLGGRPLQLSAFVEAEDRTLERLFVPFADSTNDGETYAAGRYLELDRTATGLYDLDFNRGFNPYCYFDASYDCPFPPQENRLDVAITAGEKVRPEALSAGLVIVPDPRPVP